MMATEELRSIAAANQKSVELPRGMILTPERRGYLQFLLTTLAMFIALVGSIITAALVFDHLRADVVTIKADAMGAHSDALTAGNEALAAHALAKANAVEIAKRGEVIDVLIKKKTELDLYNLSEINTAVRSLVEQRRYGITNAQWYRNEYGRSPLTEAPPVKN